MSFLGLLGMSFDVLIRGAAVVGAGPAADSTSPWPMG